MCDGSARQAVGTQLSHSRVRLTVTVDTGADRENEPYALSPSFPAINYTSAIEQQYHPTWWAPKTGRAPLANVSESDSESS
jgi:hypothetical protein